MYAVLYLEYICIAHAPLLYSILQRIRALEYLRQDLTIEGLYFYGCQGTSGGLTSSAPIVLCHSP